MDNAAQPFLPPYDEYSHLFRAFFFSFFRTCVAHSYGLMKSVEASVRSGNIHFSRPSHTNSFRPDREADAFRIERLGIMGTISECIQWLMTRVNEWNRIQMIMIAKRIACYLTNWDGQLWCSNKRKIRLQNSFARYAPALRINNNPSTP